MKLLGKEVKVGTRVRTASGAEAKIEEINGYLIYPFTVCRPGFRPYSVDCDGVYFVGQQNTAYDIEEVLDEDSSDTYFNSTELEQKNYRLTLENELLAQEVQELRDSVKHLSYTLKEETESLLLANHEKDLLNQEIARRDERIDRLEAELTAFAASRDVWKELAEKYERILKGGS